MKIYLYFILLCILIGQKNVIAKTIVVSDIDDTIRETHVLSKKRLLAPVRIQAPFHNMSEIYQELKKQNDLDFYYITSAPQKIMKRSHSHFLLQYKFPDGTIKLRSLFNSHNHKLNSIKEIIATTKIDTLILIGDNGEKDPEIYNNIKDYIQDKGLDIKIHTYIKINYPLYSGGSTIYEGQVPFVVSSELAYVLKNEGLLKEDTALSFISSAFNEDKNLIIPYWVRPSQYPSNFKIEDILSNSNIARIQNEIDRLSQ